MTKSTPCSRVTMLLPSIEVGLEQLMTAFARCQDGKNLISSVKNELEQASEESIKRIEHYLNDKQSLEDKVLEATNVQEKASTHLLQMENNMAKKTGWMPMLVGADCCTSVLPHAPPGLSTLQPFPPPPLDRKRTRGSPGPLWATCSADFPW